MEVVFLTCFFVGLFFTVISAFLSGVFGGHDHHAPGGDMDVDVDLDMDVDVGVGELDTGGLDTGGLEVGDVDVGDVSGDFDMGHDFDHSVAEMGGDGHVEVGLGDSFPALSPWSPTVICSFLTSFGGVGYLMLTSGKGGVPLSLLAGSVVGLALAAMVFYGLNKLFRAVQSSSEVRVANLIGRKAELITPIPEGGMGEISYEIRGTRMNAPARSVDGKEVSRAALVKIKRIAGTTYYVKPC